MLTVHGGTFGFVRTAEGEYFIPESKMAGAFDGDLVEIAPLPARGAQKGAAEERPAARILRVIDRAHDTVVGRYEVAEPFGVVVPEDRNISYDIFTMRADFPDVPDGALVRVRMTAYPSRHEAACGVIEEVLGTAEEATISVDAIVARNKLETVFSEGALAEAQAAQLDEVGALAAGYRDVRGRCVFTIDPADARDFDDALSLDPAQDFLRDGAVWRLGVHIADVSHYVPWNSSLDLDARHRATSVYLVDRVIPMLPEQLSNGLCSLNPNETRRCMTCDVYLDQDWKAVGYDIYPALMRSQARLTYGQVQQALDGDAALPDDIMQRVRFLSQFAKARIAARQVAGGLDFDFPEARVALDDDGKPVRVDLRRKTEATSLVEEAMILANEVVAQHLSERGFPALYRVHEKPSPDSLAALLPVLQEFSWFLRISPERFVAGDAHAIARVLSESQGRLEGSLVQTLVLRAMKRAAYKPTCDGHFGLASEAYTHFTSPIRRYPDLVVHRMLRAQLTRRPQKFEQEVAALPWIAEHASDMERVAEKAARQSQELKLIEYMAGFLGEAFDATVSGVASYGMYVSLDNTAEGMVAARYLGDEYFACDAVRYQLVGQDSGKVFRLGQRVRVVLAAADAKAGSLDFRLEK
ncbi:ribonuclease R [uncultured Senegalimassilia sp.]|uniref:ribonuclease R n=1 Tax=uncultured Senegalimassilia sp. TaxID=1714350 RepID=UPI0026E03821|nr:ribonuclease R [uncultured Senegalimassilia sp.]